MSLEQKRKALERAYPGDKWRLRVAKMSEAQVHTLYAKFLSEKKL